MKRVAFRMKLYKGREAEYKKRHDEIWPELAALLKQNGISSYSIFLDEDSGDLFGYLHCEDESRLDEQRHHTIMKKWWAYMKDIMETNPDDSPVTKNLTEVFYLK